ncbi:MAG: hypothetical protein PHO15_08810 [Eubacteriales bacterium]|nr:hypothetical protein [Eubacteriales bacterium]
MVCPNCGGQVNGNVCAGCGTVLNRKKPTGLIVLCIVLAVVITACAAAYFLLMPGQDDVGSVARNYVTAAYYTDKVVNEADSYSSYNDFKEDLDIAIGACSAIQGGVFDFLAGADIDLSLCRTAYAADDIEGLDTDAGKSYAGGYTDGARQSADEFMAAMKEDAAIAKQALTALNRAINQFSDENDIEDALDDAADTLSDADNAAIVVGDKAMSFAGIKTLDGINTAFIGVDIVIDDDTLYLGADDAVLFYSGGVGSEVTVIDSQSGDGVVMDTGNMDELQDDGGLLVITFDDIDEEPEADVFTDASEFSDYISDEAGVSVDLIAASYGSRILDQYVILRPDATGILYYYN